MSKMGFKTVSKNSNKMKEKYNLFTKQAGKKLDKSWRQWHGGLKPEDRKCPMPSLL